MERSTEPTVINSEKASLDSPPPAYFDVISKPSQVESFTLKHESLVTSPVLSEKESPLMDKMIHLETLCSSMHTMLEFQNSTYFDVKSQLNEINRSIHKDENSRRKSRIKQRLSVVLGAGDGCPDDQISNESSVQSESSECDDLGYNRVCNMLEHLLSDAKIAISKLPEDYREEESSCSTPHKESNPSFSRNKSNTISVGSPSKKQSPEVWSQFLRSGIEHQPYEVRHRLILPGFSSECDQKQITLNFSDSEFDGAFKNQPVVLSMIYWTLCFTLGVLLLDRYLVELASRQVTLAMESILPDSSRAFAHPPMAEFVYDDSKQHQAPARRNSL